jgi:hypothetical protein
MHNDTQWKYALRSSISAESALFLLKQTSVMAVMKSEDAFLSTLHCGEKESRH